jgi:ketosteroid isomerase-like protein
VYADERETIHERTLDVVMRFIDCINARDVAALTALMSPEHRFIDSEGAVHEGRERMASGWREYFRMVPDYAIDVDRTFIQGSEAIVLGTARGTYSRDGALKAADMWSTPAAWFARVENELVSEWRVYADNEPMRTRMRMPSA